MKKKKTFKTPMMESCFTVKHYTSYEEMLKDQLEELKAQGKCLKFKTNYEGLDDPDTAAQWIVKNMKCVVKNGNYEMQIEGKSGLSESDLVKYIKNAEDLNFAQKCWTMELLYDFNEAWMFSGPQNFEQYFRILGHGQFGADDIREDIKELFR